MITIYDNSPENNNQKTSTVYNEEMYKHESFEYQVVSIGEENLYHDSDFYAIVPNGKGGFKQVVYGSTRYWSYGNHATIDAPPSLLKEYSDWKLRNELKREMNLQSQEWEKFSADCVYFLGQENVDIEKLENLYNESEGWQYIIKTLDHAKRSKFNLSLRSQVLEWLQGKNDYNYPLSQNQISSLLRYFR